MYIPFILFALSVSIPFANSNEFHYFNEKDCLVMFSKAISLKYRQGEGKDYTSYALPYTSKSSVVECTKNKANFQVVYNPTNGSYNHVDLTFHFGLDLQNYISLKSITANLKCKEKTGCVEVSEEVFAKNLFHVPHAFSYKCTEISKVKLGKHDIYLDFHRFQFQFFNDKDGVFSDNVSDCVGFMSSDILTNLFVSLILIIILSYALSMIMKLQNGDKFENPKDGKAVQLGGQE